MNKKTIMALLGLFLIIGIATTVYAANPETTTPKTDNVEKNMTYGKCVSGEAVIKNSCYSAAKEAYNTCKDQALQQNSTNKDAVKSCKQTYTKDKNECKQTFKSAKKDCQKIKHNAFEEMAVAFK